MNKTNPTPTERGIEEASRIRELLYSVYNIMDHPAFEDARKKVRFARSWLGEYKGTLGAETPYSRADKPKDIPELNDTPRKVDPAKYISEDQFDDDQKLLSATNYLRGLLDSIVEDIQRLPGPTRDSTRYMILAVDDVRRARIMLGYVLGDIRDRNYAEVQPGEISIEDPHERAAKDLLQNSEIFMELARQRIKEVTEYGWDAQYDDKCNLLRLAEHHINRIKAMSHAVAPNMQEILLLAITALIRHKQKLKRKQSSRNES